jgi:hypothetical protein
MLVLYAEFGRDGKEFLTAAFNDFRKRAHEGTFFLASDVLLRRADRGCTATAHGHRAEVHHSLDLWVLPTHRTECQRKYGQSHI